MTLNRFFSSSYFFPFLVTKGWLKAHLSPVPRSIREVFFVNFLRFFKRRLLPISIFLMFFFLGKAVCCFLIKAEYA